MDSTRIRERYIGLLKYTAFDNGVGTSRSYMNQLEVWSIRRRRWKCVECNEDRGIFEEFCRL